MIVYEKTAERLHFIVSARLSQYEWEQVKTFANGLKARRTKNGKQVATNALNVYEETDVHGITQETAAEH